MNKEYKITWGKTLIAAKNDHGGLEMFPRYEATLWAPNETGSHVIGRNHLDGDIATYAEIEHSLIKAAGLTSDQVATIGLPTS